MGSLVILNFSGNIKNSKSDHPILSSCQPGLHYLFLCLAAGSESTANLIPDSANKAPY